MTNTALMIVSVDDLLIRGDRSKRLVLIDKPNRAIKSLRDGLLGPKTIF